MGVKASMRTLGSEGHKYGGYQEAVNCQVLRRNMRIKIESTDIIPIYAEHMDVGRTPAPGFDLADVCFVYDRCTAHGREGRRAKQFR